MEHGQRWSASGVRGENTAADLGLKAGRFLDRGLLVVVLFRDDLDQGLAASTDLLRRARLDEPVEAARTPGAVGSARELFREAVIVRRGGSAPEERPVSDVLLDELVDVLAMKPPVLEADDEEAVLLLGVLLALVLAVGQVELLHWEVVRVDLGRQLLGLLSALAELGLAVDNLVDDLLVV